MLFTFLAIFVLVHSHLAETLHFDSALGYSCRSDRDCSGLVSNAVCSNYRCACRTGYKANGIFRCIRTTMRQRRQIDFGIEMLGEECESNDECRRTPVDGSKGCYLNQCQCSPGYVPIDAYRCIRDFEHSSDTPSKKTSELEAPGYGSICSTNSDCRNPMVNLECSKGSCVCLPGYVPLGKYLCYHLDGNDHDEEEDEGEEEEESTTSISSRSKNGREKQFQRLDHPCTNDNFCRETVAHSHCSNGRCTCLAGYQRSDRFTCQPAVEEIGSTKRPLGGRCATDDHCQTSNAKCLDRICTCPSNYFAIDEWTCLKDSEASEEESLPSTRTKMTTTQRTSSSSTSTTTAFRWWPWSSSTTMSSFLLDAKKTSRFRCLLNRQCASVDRNSHCSLFGRCVCNSGYQLGTINGEERCVREIKIEDDCD